MHIALDSIIFGLQRFGGITTYWLELANGLAAAGVGQTLLLPRDIISGRAGEVAALAGTRQQERLPVRLARYLPAPAAKADIQHSSYYRTPLGRRSARVVTVYDFIYERYRTGLAREVHSLQKRRAVEAADAILCISTHTRDDLLERWPRIDSSRVIAVPLAVDHATWFPAETRREPTAVFVGQRRGYKRFDLAVEAVEATPGLRLAVVGPPLDPDEEALLAARLPGRHDLMPGISNEALRDLYSRASALLFPSDYEGFGLPLLEAMACGCPVIAARRSSLPEVGGDAALWVDEQRPDAWAEALGLILDEDRYRVARAAGLAQAARFTWERTVAETLAVYRKLAG